MGTNTAERSTGVALYALSVGLLDSLHRQSVTLFMVPNTSSLNKNSVMAENLQELDPFVQLKIYSYVLGEYVSLLIVTISCISYFKNSRRSSFKW